MFSSAPSAKRSRFADERDCARDSVRKDSSDFATIVRKSYSSSSGPVGTLFLLNFSHFFQRTWERSNLPAPRVHRADFG